MARNFESYSSTEIELGYTRKLLLPVAAPMGFALEVDTREDIDWLVDTIGVQPGI